MKHKKVIIIVLIIVMLIVIQRIRFLTNQSDEPKEEGTTVEETTAAPQEEIASLLNGAVGENESITAVTISDDNLKVSVDLSGADTDIELSDLAVARAGSVTDEILDHPEYDEYWNTITIDFGGIGNVTRSKEDIKENEYNMRYFEIDELD